MNVIYMIMKLIIRLVISATLIIHIAYVGPGPTGLGLTGPPLAWSRPGSRVPPGAQE